MNSAFNTPEEDIQHIHEMLNSKLEHTNSSTTTNIPNTLKSPHTKVAKFSKLFKNLQPLNTYTKHKRHLAHIAFASLAIFMGMFLYNKFAFAATYNFAQYSWAGGVDTSSVATHASNQSNWTKYYSATGLTTGATISITPSNFSFLDDGVASGSGTNVVITDGLYTVYKFSTPSSFTPPAGVTSTEVLVVGGGGGGGGRHGGGGGAGGLVYHPSYAVTPGVPISLTVGAGGVGSSGDIGSNGTASTFGTITANGGGGGSSYTSQAGPGGSGGGGGGGGAGGTGAAANQTNSGGGTGYGNAGGNAGNVGANGGGGGGAGAVGSSPTTGFGGVGGNGLQFSISGTPTYYAGGGGGGSDSGQVGGAGGLGGGGAGGDSGGAGINGTPNTGGGGGGSRSISGQSGGTGGSGVVIVRYLTPVDGSTTTPTSGGGFQNGTNASTTISGSSASSSVVLVPPGVVNLVNIGISSGNSYSVIDSVDGLSVYVVNYSSNSISQFSKNPSTGAITALSPSSVPSNGLSPHSIAISPDDTNVYVTNNASSTVAQFSRNISTGALTPLATTTVASGSGPQRIKVSSDGKNVYVANSSGSISQYSRNLTTGELTPLSPATIVGGSSDPWDIVISPDGKNVYATNNGGVKISMFSRDQSTGLLTALSPSFISFGSGTKGLAISSDGLSVYAGSSNNNAIGEFSRDPTTGLLTYLNTIAAGAYNQSIIVSPDGLSVYTANQNSSTFSQYSRDPVSGLLTAGTPASFSTGANPRDIYISSDGGSIYVANSGGNTISYFSRYTGSNSGTFTSAVINLGGQASPTTLTYTKTTNASTSITMDIRAGNTPTPDGTWTAWTTGVASGGDISGLGFKQYFQYRANLATVDKAYSPSLDDVTINYSRYSFGTLTSSIYDSGDATNLVTNMRWTATGTSSTETIKFQLRSGNSTTTLAAAPWCGTGITCDSTTYFTDSSGGTVLASNHPLRSGNDDRYFQYRVILSSGGAFTPTLTSATVQYVVNAPPEFDTAYGTNGISAYQIATSSDPNFGKVNISYRIRDPDSTTGTANPGYVTPTFEYNTGSGWVAIATSSLEAGDTNNKAVDNVNYTTYTAIWTASTTLPNLFASSTQIRVTLNDNEGANNTASASSAVFSLDTSPPVVSTIFDSSTGSSNAGTLYLSTTDNNQTQYRLCNDSSFPTTDTQGNSCAWSTLSGNLASSSINWIPTGYPSNETMYLQVKDALGNITVRTIVSPALPSNFDFKDVSNTAINVYREFISWGVFTATTSSSFASYKVYHSTDGISYSVLTTITDPALNYYKHDITTATTSTHFYKVVAVDTDGDISDYTTVLSDVPNGQGSSDTTPPTVDPATILVPSGTLKNTSAQVTFTTDEISKGEVQYKKSTDSGWLTVSSISYVLNHSIYIQGLTSNTTYDLRVKAEDVAGNISTYVNGPSFTTVGGPVITGVNAINLTDNSVTIFWNTSTSSDSYVYYSTNQNIIPSVTEWSATNVPCITDVCQHKVNITGLTPGTRYYYYVKSTDAASNSSTDDNNGSYFTFSTTLDVNPPEISSIATPVISSVSAVIVWQTDEPATTQVQWGTSSGNLNRTTILDPVKSVYHVVTLSSATNDSNSLAQTLTPSTPYYFKVFSNDAANNQASSTEQTFTTTQDGQVTIVTQYVYGGGGGAAPSEPGVTPDTTPPVINSIETDNITAFSADVKVVTSESTRVFIDYGTTADYGDTIGDIRMLAGHIIKLKKLQTGTTYHYKVSVVDVGNNVVSSEDRTFTTSFISELSEDRTFLDKATDIQGKLEQLIESALPSLSPPSVSTPEIFNITESSASITWKTNIKTMGSLRYSKDSEYTATSSYSIEASSGQEKKSVHTVDLNNLQPNTKYHIQATSYVFPQVVGKSPDLTFTTKAAKIKASIVEKKNDSFTVAWSSDEPTSSIVEYKNTKTGETNRITDDSKKTFHSVKIENLPSAVTYTVKVSGINSIGNTVEAAEAISVTTSSDVVAPIISNFKVDNALVPGRTDRIQTVIGWQTDEPANSVVYYEEGVGTPENPNRELASKVESLDNYTLNHIMILASLKPGTVYRIKIVSADSSGNTKTFGPSTIITPRQTESVLDIIFKNFEDTFKFLRRG